MAVRFALTRIVPSLLLYVALLACAVLVDAILHFAGVASIGRWFGPAGTAILLASFLYSLRKRKLVRTGSPRSLLAAHEILGWGGALLLLVHGGIHLNAALPWVAVAAMLVVVGSGLTGKFLLAEARESLKSREEELAREGRSAGEIERELLGHSLLVGTMQQWRRVHMPLTMVFAALALLHVASVVLFWRWR